jgi:MoxR-like ATPase
VQALAFNPRFLNDLLMRIEENIRPEELVPGEIIFSEQEIDSMGEQIREIAVPESVRRRVEFFASQFELCETAGGQFEYMTKDTARLSGLEWRQVVAADNGRDRLKDLGCQTRNGVSVRNLMSLLIYAKALAYFRGNREVELEDLRLVLPFVMNDKLHPDLDAPFFALPENAAYRTDRLSWLRRLFDLSNDEFNRLDLDNNDPVSEMATQFEKGLDGLKEREALSRLATIERLITERVKGRKLYGPLYDDLLKLKYLHQRYTNYVAWLRMQ